MAVSDLTVVLTIDTARAEQALIRVSEDLDALAELCTEVSPHASIHVDVDALTRDMVDRYVDWSAQLYVAAKDGR